MNEFGEFFGPSHYDLKPKKSKDKSDESATAPKETESKIVNLGPEANFLRNIELIKQNELIKSEEIYPERLLIDEVYELEKDTQSGKKKKRQIDLQLDVGIIDPSDVETFIKSIEFLGLNVTKNQVGLQISGEFKGKKATVRVRKDGNTDFLTVKANRKKDGSIKIADEYESKLENPEAVKNFLESLGYRKEEHREKLRTTWQIVFKGQKVKIELNKSSNSKVPAWIEIEGPNKDIIVEVAQLVGYNKKDMTDLSDRQLYKKNGLTAEEIKNLRFDLKQ